MAVVLASTTMTKPEPMVGQPGLQRGELNCANCHETGA